MMSLVQTEAADGTVQLATVRERHLKAPISLAIVTALLAVLFLAVPRSGISTFHLGDRTSAFELPDVELPTAPTFWVVFAVLVVLTVGAFLRAWTYRAPSIWLIVAYGVLAVFAFLVWAAAGASSPSRACCSVPCRCRCRSCSARSAASSANGPVSSTWPSRAAAPRRLLGGAAVQHHRQRFRRPDRRHDRGVLVASVLAAFAIKYLVEQVIVGVVLNVLVTGLTGFLYGALLAPNEAELNTPVRFSRIEIPVLSDIPIIGPVLFNQTFIVYLMFITVAVVAWGLYRTKWGLRLRAVGEHPQAADTVGIRVNPTRFWNVLLAGAIAGIGGAYFTLVSVPQFGKEMTAGLGFIALAAVIFGRWDPIRATLAALLFGFATNLQNLLSILKTPIPGEFMLMLPYVVTLLAVAGFAGQIRGPAASGKPYIKS